MSGNFEHLDCLDWVRQQFVISMNQALLRGKKSCFKANKSMHLEGMINLFLVNIFCFASD